MSSRVASAALRRRTALVVGIAALAGVAIATALWARAQPAGANPLTGIAAVAAGEAHTCALTSAASVKCWGSNSHGQLGVGLGSLGNQLVPFDVPGLAGGVAAVSAGLRFNCAVTVAGGVKCWGALGSTVTADIVDVCAGGPSGCSAALSGVVAVTAGSQHACALTMAGGVKCWGNGASGQLGDGTTIGHDLPDDVNGLSSGVAAVAAGGSHTCALTATGGVKCWGRNVEGQLGVATTQFCGTDTCSKVPLDVPGLLSGVSAITAGYSHTCALLASGGVKCWGSDGTGQLGDGPGGTFSLSPVDVLGMGTGTAAVAAGSFHTCAVTTTGALKCWGLNNRGQLGDGLTCGIECSSPVSAFGLSAGALSVAAGTQSTCAVMTGGGLKCWGENSSGQVGDGTTQQRTIPADVVVLNPKPTATPTPCPPGGCPTPTRTATPTATPTPAGPPAQMSLNVVGGACDRPVNPVKCDVMAGSQFSLLVSVDSLPEPGGYTAIGTDVYIADLAYKRTASAVEEIVWPDLGGLAVRSAFTRGQVKHGGFTSGFPPLPISTYTGAVVQIALTCSQSASSNRLALLPASPTNPNGSLFLAPDGSTTTPARTIGQEQLDLNGDTVPETVDVADSLDINCVQPTPTPTATPTNTPAAPINQKLPRLANLFLTRQGTKIPPPTCLASTDVAKITDALSVPITLPDPKNPSQPQRLGGFSFEVRFDAKQVCVELRKGSAAANMTCTIQDAVTDSTLQGIARISCVTLGKTGFPDTATTAGRQLARLLVRPQPELYSQIRANQDNGVVMQLLNQDCKLSDLQGGAIATASCDDADVTIRFLEGDVVPDCRVDTLDTQAIAFRWGSIKGSLIFNGRFDLMPSGTGFAGDDRIDVNDLQFVYGRFGSTCAAPWPAQPPANPKM